MEPGFEVSSISGEKGSSTDRHLQPWISNLLNMCVESTVLTSRPKSNPFLLILMFKCVGISCMRSSVLILVNLLSAEAVRLHVLVFWLCRDCRNLALLATFMDWFAMLPNLRQSHNWVWDLFPFLKLHFVMRICFVIGVPFTMICGFYFSLEKAFHWFTCTWNIGELKCMSILSEIEGVLRPRIPFLKSHEI